MNAPSLGTVLKAALVAGLAAGLTVALFHAVVTEPVIDQAIVLEEQHGAAGHQVDAPLVSRDTQRKGLVVGFVLYGLVWASLLGVAYHLVRQRLAIAGGLKVALLVALAGYWSVGLLPLLKYPANPPGVGDPETIAYRQALYVAFLGLSVAGTVVAVALGRRLGRGAAGSGLARLLTAALVVLVGVLLYAVMPANPDPVELPADLVSSFRALSLAGLTLFWVVLGLLFGKLLSGRAAARQARV